MAATPAAEPQTSPLTIPSVLSMLPAVPSALAASPQASESLITPRLRPQLAPSEQVSPVAIALSLGGGKEGRIALVLDPAELGRVEVTVERIGDATRVQVAAERPETLALLARDSSALDRALGGAGIGAEGGRSLGFSLLGGDAGGQAMGGGAQEDARKSGRGWHGPAQDRNGARQDHDMQRRALLGLLDIAI
ncbi:flagellar hook-length control protein FliK [Roseomonas xinghualingensis]|uniref:flagellar hook-length control protein FliK n=1 Tax=Roseomonas xinghualingensis TaxID=2986475 RepID=UPI0021F1D95D|nr:flagellar hook-length control protein FliK [Roseomonas sp. SXEYE001]MCV4207515.1 flagellar hook-length control protein FliK [Roseomonas sp. SXEYE001]